MIFEPVSTFAAMDCGSGISIRLDTRTGRNGAADERSVVSGFHMRTTRREAIFDRQQHAKAFLVFCSQSGDQGKRTDYPLIMAVNGRLKQVIAGVRMISSTHSL